MQPSIRQFLAGLHPLRILVRQRFLIVQLLKRDIASRTSGTWMGGLWLIIQPSLQVIAFWFLLDLVFRARSPGTITYLEYFLTSMLPWLFISDSLNRSLTVLSEFGALYQRTRFPVSVLPLLPVVLSAIIYLPIYCFVAAFFQGGLAGLKALVIIAGLFIWVYPFAYFLAVIGLFVREVRQIFPFMLTMLLYVTPVMYAPEMLPDSVRWMLAFNPFADIVALLQGWLHDFPVEPGNVLRPLLLWVCSAAPAWLLFKRTEPHMREML